MTSCLSFFFRDQNACWIWFSPMLFVSDVFIGQYDPGAHGRRSKCLRENSFVSTEIYLVWTCENFPNENAKIL